MKIILNGQTDDRSFRRSGSPAICVQLSGLVWQRISNPQQQQQQQQQQQRRRRRRQQQQQLSGSAIHSFHM